LASASIARFLEGGTTLQVGSAAATFLVGGRRSHRSLWGERV